MSHIQGPSSSSVDIDTITLTETQKKDLTVIKLRARAIEVKKEVKEEVHIPKKVKQAVKQEVEQEVLKKVKQEVKEGVDSAVWAMLDDPEVLTPEVVIDSDDDAWGEWQGKSLLNALNDRSDARKERILKREIKRENGEDGRTALSLAVCKNKARPKAKTALSLAVCKNKARPEAELVPTPPGHPPTARAREMDKNRATARAQEMDKDRAAAQAQEQKDTTPSMFAALGPQRHLQFEVGRAKYWQMQNTAENNLRKAIAKLYNTGHENVDAEVRRQDIASVDLAKVTYIQIRVRCGHWALVQKGADPCSEKLMADLRVAAIEKLNNLEVIILDETLKDIGRDEGYSTR